MAKREFRRPIPVSKEPEHRINDFIRVPEIRLIGDMLEELSTIVGENIEPGIYPTRKARLWADKAELDLVEISPNAVPPVAKIVDYAKFLYQKKKKEKEMKANAVKVVLKEIRFGPQTDQHDYEFKLKHAVNFLKENSKVKCYVNFRGRQIVFKDQGEILLLRFIQELAEYGLPESLPKLEGRRMSVIIAPKKTAAAPKK